MSDYKNERYLLNIKQCPVMRWQLSNLTNSSDWWKSNNSCIATGTAWSPHTQCPKAGMLQNHMHKSSFKDLRLNSCVKTSPAVETGLDSPALLTLVWMFIHSFLRPPVACLSWPSLSSPRLPTPCHLAPSLVSFPQPQLWAETPAEAQILQKVPSARPMGLYPSLPVGKKGQKEFLDSQGSLPTKYNSFCCQLIES